MPNRRLAPSVTALLCLTLPCLLVIAAPAARGEDVGPELDGAALYDRVRSASVEVLVGGHLDGSGWFASDDGIVVTAAHVVWKKAEERSKKQPADDGGDGRDRASSRDSLQVVSPALGRLAARVLCVDRGHDLALLQADLGGKKCPWLGVADAMPRPLDDVMLFGSAFYRHELLIRGSVARPAPTFEYFEEEYYARVYHVTAPSPPGTSGGCWVDRRGRVVGNQSGFVSIEHVGAGIALVVPPGAIAALLARRTDAHTPTLGCGLEELESESAGYIARFPRGAAGLVPVLVRKGGPAARAGLDDQKLVVAIDGHTFGRRDEFLSRLVAHRPGDRVALTLLAHDGTESRVEVELAGLEDAER